MSDEIIVPPEKTSGQQLALFDPRYAGAIAGKKRGSLFGDVARGPSSDLEKAAELTPLEKKFSTCKSGVLL